jgi:hypothetical protein
MIRKLLFSAAAVLALGSVAATPADAGHFDFRVRSRFVDFRFGGHHCHYHVLVRHCCHDPWQCYGTYDCRCEADRVACFLRSQGLLVRVKGH